MMISVIIPTLNESSTIARTLTRTVALGFDDIIVSDGGSSDSTRPRWRQKWGPPRWIRKHRYPCSAKKPSRLRY